jgi:glycosyltransferase involved in cell wall biosynthesis
MSDFELRARRDSLAPASPAVALRALVAHPGRQHSHQLALALHEHRELLTYLCGVPVGAPPWWPVFALPTYRRAVQYGEVTLPPTLCASNPVAPLLRRIGGFSRRAAWRAEWAGFELFDRWAARRIAAARPNLVVAYENAAGRSFAAARRVGAVTVLDAASLAWPAVERLLPGALPPEHLRAERLRKQAELIEADTILVLSAQARDSYLECGIAAERIAIVPLGVDHELFRPRATAPVDGPFRFVFVGHPGPRKGFDLLLSALTAVVNEQPRVVLECIGAAPEVAPALGPHVRRHGQLAPPAVASLLAECDALVLPSRFDGFGLVVLEALACGVPVLASTRVGAASLLTPGRTGLTVPAGDGPALTEAMRWMVAHRDTVAGWRASCRALALGYGWSDYRIAVRRALHQALARRSMPGRAEP